jgi:hypothetical protein
MLELHPLQRGIGQLREIQMHAPERVYRGRAGVGGGCCESSQQASVVQQLQDLPAETVGVRGFAELRLSLQYERSHSGQAQLSGQHHAGRPGAHDYHVGVNYTHFTPPISVGSGLRPASGCSSFPFGSALSRAPLALGPNEGRDSADDALCAG